MSLLLHYTLVPLEVSRQMIQIPIRIGEDAKEAIESLAFFRNQSQQDVIREAIKQHLKANQKAVIRGREMLQDAERKRDVKL